MPSAVINLSTTQAHGLAAPASLVSQFVSLKEQLIQREQSLAAELAQIHAALKDPPGQHSPPARAVLPVPHSSGQRTGLTAAIAGVLAPGPQSKEQILQKLIEQSFPLPANPRPAVNAVLYSNKRFRREGKLFSLVEKAA